MKLITSLCAVVVVVSATQKELFKLPPESLTKMHKIATPCAEKFNIDPTYIRKLGDETLPRDDATNKFLHCFGINSGLIDEEGHIVLDRIVGIVGDHPLVEKIKEETRKCNKITKENAVATVVAMHDCYGKNFPMQFVF